MQIPRGRTVFLLLAALFGANGCVHTGSVALPEGARSIAVPIVENRTLEYGAEERLTDALVQEFLRDGRLEVLPSRAADLQLEAALVRYQLRALSYDAEEQAVAFQLQTRLLVTVTDRRSGKRLLEEEPFEESGVFFLSNRPEARREEQIYRRLAQALISRLLDGW